MFWTDWGAEPKIERAGMDGSERRLLVTENVLWPNGLTLDLVSERLYWVDAKLNLIGEVGMDGRGARVVHRSADTLSHPFGIVVFEDWVYWSERGGPGRNGVYRASKRDGTGEQGIAGATMVNT